MASFEDLRDTYKSSRKARYAKAKANGASYSNKFNKLLHKESNLIVKENHGRAKGTEFDDKYNLNASNIEFSLNKKGRWNIVSDLKSQMPEFEKENLDVNVYLTRNRIKNNTNNCIGVMKSKGGKIKVKSTYANTDSLIENDKLERYRKANPEKMSEKKKSGKLNNHIVIEVDQDDEEDEDSNYLIYKVQYGAREDVLKYGSLFDYDDKNVVKSKRMTNVLGDEASYCSSKSYEFEDVDFSDDYDSEENDVVVEDSKLADGLEKTITLEELINEYTKPIIEKHKNKSENKEGMNKVSEESVRKLVYLTRQLSINEARKHLMKPNLIAKNKIENFKTITQKFVASTIISETLKSAHGINYCEAYNSTPRIFVINMFKDVTDRLTSKNIENLNFNVNIYDIKIWVLLKEEYEDATAIQNCEVKSYIVGIKTNIKCKLKVLKQLNNDQVMSFCEFYSKLVDLIAGEPIGSFIKKPVTTAVYNQKAENYTQLNNLINKNECKGINELRTEFIETIQNKETNTNSDAINEDEDETNLDENNIKQNYENVLSTKSCCCYLCFDENIHINKCGILKNCSHSFCDSCWKTYIDSRLENRLLSSGILLCPGCDNEIDLALIIYHASDVDKLERYIDDCVEKVLFVLSGYKWCASSMCRKAVKVDLKSSPNGIVSCDCGYQACLKCNMEPHFPAKCSQIAKYYRELKVENKGVKLEDIYKGEGKKCPKCECLIEKIEGCNYMKCCTCKTEFCWQCCKTWTEHLSYNGGNHGCKITQNIGVVTYEFKKKVKPKTLKESDYQDSIYHRNQRLNTKYKEIKSNIARIMQSYKIDKEFKDENELQNYEKLNLLERCKIELIKKNEVRSFLHKLSGFLKELHFICEHSYLLLHDNNIEKVSRSTVSSVLKSIELIIWKIRYTFTHSNGNDAVNELRSLMDKGLNCLNKISNLKIK